jgi:hypothetical protein
MNAGRTPNASEFGSNVQPDAVPAEGAADFLNAPVFFEDFEVVRAPADRTAL